MTSKSGLCKSLQCCIQHRVITDQDQVIITIPFGMKSPGCHTSLFTPSRDAIFMVFDGIRYQGDASLHETRIVSNTALFS